MSFPKIEPCPFCGSEAVLRRDFERTGHGERVEWSAVRCTVCTGEFREYDQGSCDTGVLRALRAIQGWNQRVKS